MEIMAGIIMTEFSLCPELSTSPTLPLLHPSPLQTHVVDLMPSAVLATHFISTPAAWAKQLLVTDVNLPSESSTFVF